MTTCTDCGHDHAHEHDAPDPYDKEAVYDAQVMPLMDQIRSICREHHIPFIAHFAYGYDGENMSSGAMQDDCGNTLPMPFIAAHKLASMGEEAQQMLRCMAMGQMMLKANELLRGAGLPEKEVPGAKPH